MHMQLHRMLRPMAAPIIIRIQLHGFIHLVDAVGKQVLDTSVLGKGDMRTLIEDEAGVLEGGRVAAVISVLVIHHRRNGLGVKPERRSKSRHSASQNDNVWHESSLFLNSWPLQFLVYTLQAIRGF